MAKQKNRPPYRDEDLPPKFKLGDRVVCELGMSTVEAVVVEDRGRLGVGGRRLYGIHYQFSPEETRYGELPEEDLTLAAAT